MKEATLDSSDGSADDDEEDPFDSVDDTDIDRTLIDLDDSDPFEEPFDWGDDVF